MKKVLFDTCILIRLMNEAEDLHPAILKCFEYCLEKKMLITTSAVCIAEYSVVSDATQIMPQIKVQPFTHQMAIIAGKLTTSPEKGEKRDAIKDDFKIIASAIADNVDFVVTTDQNTFAKYAERARKSFGANFKTVLFDANTKFSPSLFDTESELETWAKEHNV